MPKAPAKKTAAKTAPKKSSNSVLYPEVSVQVCVGEDSISDEKAKQILGWRELPDDSKEEFLFKDQNGKKIQCTNNLRNRMLYASNVEVLAQEILRGRWKFNGENLIIGQRGTVLNGQHSLIAVVMACQMYDLDPEEYPYWFSEREERPSIEKSVCFGVEESDDVVNTMDTCKPRSLTDVIFRSEYFAKLPTSIRKNLSAVLDYGIRLLWFRTGLGTVAYAPKRTHSEALDFVNRHPRLLECVKHVGDTESLATVKKYIAPGTAAGLMYLMGTSASTADEYRASSNPDENLLSFDLWDKAEEFWALIGSDSPTMAPLKKSIGALIEGEGGGSNAERIAVIVKAWNCFVNNDKIQEKDLKLKYVTDDDGFKTLAECPTTGGIDVGVPSSVPEPELSPEEIKRAAKKIQEERLEESSDENKASKKAAKKVLRSAKEPAVKKSKVETLNPGTLKEGESLWVTQDGEKWKGTYVDSYAGDKGVVLKIKANQGYAGAGKTFDVPIKDVSR